MDPYASNPPCVEPTTTLPRFNGAWSRHSGGVNAAMGDGSVRFFKNSVSLPVWRALSTTRGTEVLAPTLTNGPDSSSSSIRLRPIERSGRPGFQLRAGSQAAWTVCASSDYHATIETSGELPNWTCPSHQKQAIVLIFWENIRTSAGSEPSMRNPNKNRKYSSCFERLRSELHAVKVVNRELSSKETHP